MSLLLKTGTSESQNLIMSPSTTKSPFWNQKTSKEDFASQSKKARNKSDVLNNKAVNATFNTKRPSKQGS